MKALIVGCGYAGLRLAERLLGLGLVVVGITRSRERASVLEPVGIAPLIVDLQDPGALEEMARLEAQLVFYLVPPVGPGEEPLRRVLEISGSGLEAFVYASSTSVYGDRGGEWVDETTEIDPSGAVGQKRRLAEDLVLEATAANNTPTRICRITGIYGPGRTLRRPLESGRYKLIRGRDTWVNRIHVDDLASSLLAAWQHGSDGGIYNLVDAEPHLASAFAFLAADLHGLPRPEWIAEEEAYRRYDEAQLRRKLDSKRVRSTRLKTELRVELEYPSYRVGLPAAVAADRKAG